MPQKQRKLAAVFAALGDATRLEIVERLAARGPASITALGEGSRITRQAVTKHLHVLARAGVIKGEKHGREHCWKLEHTELAAAERHIGLIARGWEAALDRLKYQVEKESSLG